MVLLKKQTKKKSHFSLFGAAINSIYSNLFTSKTKVSLGNTQVEVKD